MMQKIVVCDIRMSVGPWVNLVRESLKSPIVLKKAPDLFNIIKIMN